MLIDTHCHIHDQDYPLDAAEVLDRARQAGVDRLICVGTSQQSSADAVEFAMRHPQVYAAIGVHPHDTKDGWDRISMLAKSYASRGQVQLPAVPPAAALLEQASVRLADMSENSLSSAELADAQTSSTSRESSDISAGNLDSVPAKATTGGTPAARKLIAVGEIGLDYYYDHSPRDVQIQALESQIQTALDHHLPIIFHVRDAVSATRAGSVWRDFWPVFDNFHGITGELHSFTDSQANLDQALQRGLYIGVNGISTFTKDATQQSTFANVPLDRMLLETDAPFLTPAPKRGTINEPAFVSYVARHHATIRGMSVDDIAAATTANATALFAL